MTKRGWYIFFLGCVVWVFLLVIAQEDTYNDFLDAVGDLREEPLLIASAAWCGASFLLGKIFGGK